MLPSRKTNLEKENCKKHSDKNNVFCSIRSFSNILFEIESILFYHFEMTWPFRRNKCFMLCDRKFKSSDLE